MYPPPPINVTFYVIFYDMENPYNVHKNSVP